MLIGQSPFSGCDEDELFWSICNEIPWYPHYLSKEALKCLQSLLEKDVTIRLGSIGSSEGDIKYHPFFADINWERLERREMEPPFKPQVVSSRLQTADLDRVYREILFAFRFSAIHSTPNISTANSHVNEPVSRPSIRTF